MALTHRTAAFDAFTELEDFCLKDMPTFIVRMASAIPEDSLDMQERTYVLRISPATEFADLTPTLMQKVASIAERHGFQKMQALDFELELR